MITPLLVVVVVVVVVVVSLLPNRLVTREQLTVKKPRRIISLPWLPLLWKVDSLNISRCLQDSFLPPHTVA